MGAMLRGSVKGVYVKGSMSRGLSQGGIQFEERSKVFPHQTTERAQYGMQTVNKAAKQNNTQLGSRDSPSFYKIIEIINSRVYIFIHLNLFACMCICVCVHVSVCLSISMESIE